MAEPGLDDTDTLTGLTNRESGARIAATENACAVVADQVGVEPLRIATILLVAQSRGHESDLRTAVEAAVEKELPRMRREVERQFAQVVAEGLDE